jgi:hypothetical protein
MQQEKTMNYELADALKSGAITMNEFIAFTFLLRMADDNGVVVGSPKTFSRTMATRIEDGLSPAQFSRVLTSLRRKNYISRNPIQILRFEEWADLARTMGGCMSFTENNAKGK